jgi:hypothetical protein
MAKIKSGGGLTSNKLVNVGVRTGSPSKATSPAAASQLGQSTAFKKETVDGGGRGDRSPVLLGNAKALAVGKGSPGADRDVHRSGSQGTWGSVVAGEPEQGSTADRGPRAILGPKGSTPLRKG